MGHESSKVMPKEMNTTFDKADKCNETYEKEPSPALKGQDENENYTEKEVFLGPVSDYERSMVTEMAEATLEADASPSDEELTPELLEEIRREALKIADAIQSEETKGPYDEKGIENDALAVSMGIMENLRQRQPHIQRRRSETREHQRNPISDEGIMGESPSCLIVETEEKEDVFSLETTKKLDRTAEPQTQAPNSAAAHRSESELSQPGDEGGKMEPIPGLRMKTSLEPTKPTQPKDKLSQKLELQSNAESNQPTTEPPNRRPSVSRGQQQIMESKSLERNTVDVELSSPKPVTPFFPRSLSNRPKNEPKKFFETPQVLRASRSTENVAPTAIGPTLQEKKPASKPKSGQFLIPPPSRLKKRTPSAPEIDSAQPDQLPHPPMAKRVNYGPEKFGISNKVARRSSMKRLEPGSSLVGVSKIRPPIIKSSSNLHLPGSRLPAPSSSLIRKPVATSQSFRMKYPPSFP